MSSNVCTAGIQYFLLHWPCDSFWSQ